MRPWVEAVVRANRKRGRKADCAESLQVTLTRSLQTHMDTPHTLSFSFESQPDTTVSAGCLRALVSSWCHVATWWCSAGSFADLLTNMNGSDGSRLDKGATAGDTSKEDGTNAENALSVATLCL